MLYQIAYHEMRHALVALVLPGVDPEQKASIIPRDVGALGDAIEKKKLSVGELQELVPTRSALARLTLVADGGQPVGRS
jgi:cell division protease FtsH